jgi:chitodextrinase
MLYALVACCLVFTSLVQTVKAACSPQATDKGVATVTLEVPVTGSYRFWSRMMSSGANNDSFTLDVDDTTCGIVVGDSALPASSWVWVDYQSATTSNKINLSLTAGRHTFKLYGRENGVKVDRVILSADQTCIPTGTGNNCITTNDTIAPVASISSPLPNTTISDAVDVSASATDNVGISSVEFWLDGARFATDTTAPYSASFDSATKPNGAHSLQVKAVDTSGNIGNSPVTTVTIANDNQPPSVRLTAPTAGTVSGEVAMTAEASDDIAISRLEFYANNFLIGAITEKPYTINWMTTKAPNSTVAVHAVAYDNAGHSTTSSPVTVTITNSPADTAAPTAPTSLRVISASHNSVSLAWNASSDNTGVEKYAVIRNNTLLAYATSTSYIDQTVSENSSYTYTVKALDAAQNMSAASNTLSIATPAAPDTQPPVVQLTSPSAGTVRGSVTMSATATDNRGVASVAFYANNYLIGSDSSAPYAITWDTLLAPDSSVAVTAVAKDVSANTTTASPVNVSIDNIVTDTTPPGPPTNLKAVRASKLQINLSWSAPYDNVGIARYDIYRNGLKIGSTSNKSYGDGNTKYATTYTYKIVAIDTSGNPGAPSNAAMITTGSQ